MKPWGDFANAGGGGRGNLCRSEQQQQATEGAGRGGGAVEIGVCAGVASTTRDPHNAI